MTTIQTAQSNLSNEQIKDTLIKYCYFDSRSEGEHCRWLLIKMLQETTNFAFLRDVYSFFVTHIHIFYFENRGKFNQIRAFFMRKLLSMLILEANGETLCTDEFTLQYTQWLAKCHIVDCPKCYNALLNANLIKPMGTVHTY